MEIKIVKVSDLIPYEKNPRKNDKAVEYVANSIKEFGFKVPIVIDTSNVIVAGHTRFKAAKLLHINEVPCIVADDLTEEQVKAFRLADNKVSEQAKWDVSLLDIEIEGIGEIDMSNFGFEIKDIIEVETEEEEKENERMRTDNSYNLMDFDADSCEGKYQIPIIYRCDFLPKELISFNYAKTSKKIDCGIHFFIDDYQFERVWVNPIKYIDMLAKYDCIFTPDFSLYKDMPMAMKIWNVYRSRLIGQIAQRMGLNVLPTVSWAEKETFDFCFDGLPKYATLVISTIGVKKNDENFSIWKDGVDEMIRRLHPTRIIVYGGAIDYDFGNIEVIFFNNTNTERIASYDKK